jgi:hypothetical protein
MELAELAASEQDPERLSNLIAEIDSLLAEKQNRLTHGPKVATSPITLRCPCCHAEPGDVCEVLLNEGLGIVHVERTQAALAVDCK